MIKKIKLEKGGSNYPILSPERVIVKTEVIEAAEAVQSPFVSPALNYVSNDSDEFQYHSRDLESNESLSDVDEEAAADFFYGWL